MLFLSEGICEELDFYLGVDALVQYIIYGIEDGHVDVHVAVDLLHTLGAEESLGNHLHLNLGRFHAVAFADHGTKGAVAGEIAVTGHQQVAHIDGIVDVTVEGSHGTEETVHLKRGIRHQYGLEVVTVFQTRTDTGGNGIDILQNGGILDADDIGGGFGLDVFGGDKAGKSLGLLFIGTTDSEVGQTLKGYFLCMGWTAYTGEVLVWHVINLMEILGAYQILVGHDALDGRDDELVAKPGLQLLQMVLQIR